MKEENTNWGKIYALVIVYSAALITALWAFSRYFS